MTKLKSKKMTKSTLAIIIMGIVIVALLAFGGSFALFTAQASNTTGSFTTGKVVVKNNGSVKFTNALVMPGQNVIESGSISIDTHDSTVAQYVFVKLTLNVANGTGTLTPTISTTGENHVWEDYTATQPGVYYKLTTGEEEDPILFTNSIVFNATANYFDGLEASEENLKSTNTAVENAAITVSVQVASVQAYGMNNNVATAFAAVTFPDLT